ncbi:hypothetical protein KAFR_0C04430 [Kazachstania africana CBS 2517]|uniref:Peptide hydrolase n=1 Tax=Kazachstania africana (strain ATCC 22294 / BCRC 22015 / CBS 2517 / CECT 1963 / NBRC 1671 / NRRL Y-8276) TaxID=1071382 RepID=H2AST3_KAZAF|nr:hypothetical protein KAFR_0C04430 [Kazachstania africana CBS 2517]CCF57433.1 hypothetical protein KAFR_0C04430 [Kazachstania africana CBS 2517]
MGIMNIQLYLYFALLVVFQRATCYDDRDLRLSYYNATLSNQLSLTNASNPYNLLLPFNTTRVVGSEESRSIQNFIIEHFGNLTNNWELERDSFTENGYNFTNLIFTLNENHNDRYVVYAAHYDTIMKLTGFTGAADSAASCAILLYLAQFIDFIYEEDLTNLEHQLFDKGYGIKIIFFDGEEAFEEWTDDDSIYGARHLASKWESDSISQIELLVLLDLIGSEQNLTMKSYFKETHREYELLSKIEDEYLDEKVYRSLTSYRNGGISSNKELDPSYRIYEIINKSLIGDDHVPFYERGVPILHLIPYPFPKTWHTISDDFEHLDQDEIYKWAIMLCEFALKVVQ